MFLALRYGMKSVTKQMGSMFEAVSAKTSSADKVSQAIPSGSAAQFDLLSPKTAAKGSGPIRSGLSLKDLLPRPKQKVALGNDPFERLALAARCRPVRALGLDRHIKPGKTRLSGCCLP